MNRENDVEDPASDESATGWSAIAGRGAEMASGLPIAFTYDEACF